MPFLCLCFVIAFLDRVNIDGGVKRDFLHHSRSADEIGLMRAIKNLLGLAGVLNAGRIL